MKLICYASSTYSRLVMTTHLNSSLTVQSFHHYTLARHSGVTFDLQLTLILSTLTADCVTRSLLH